MADPALAGQAIGSVEVDVRAKIEKFEGDLARVRELLTKFDQANISTARSVRSVDTSSSDAADSTRNYGSAVSKAGMDLKDFGAANDNVVKAQKEYQQSLAKSQDQLKGFSSAQKAANDNTEASSKTWTESAKNFKETGTSIFKTGAHILEVAGYLKLMLAVLHASNPAIKAFTDSGIGKVGTAFSNTTKALSGFVPEAVKAAAVSSTLATNIKKTMDVAKPINQIMDVHDIYKLTTAFPMLAASILTLSPAARQVALHELGAGIKATGNLALAATPPIFRMGAAVTRFLMPTLAFVAKMAVPVLAVSTAIEAVGTAWEESGKRIKEVQDLLKRSLETGLGIEPLQRIEKTAKSLNITVDSLTKSLTKFKEVNEFGAASFKIKQAKDADAFKKTPEFATRAAPAFEGRLDELKAAGKLAKNEFVEAFKSAQTTEEKFEAAVKIITKAYEQGERLAGLNLASTFLSDEAMERLKANPYFLEEMLKKAKEIEKTKLISVEQVVLASDIAKKMEEAEKLLGEKWIPFQEQLIRLGLVFRSIWADFLIYVAKTLSEIMKLPDRINEAVEQIQKEFQQIVDMLPKPIKDLLKFVGTFIPSLSAIVSASITAITNALAAAFPIITAAVRLFGRYWGATVAAPPAMKPGLADDSAEFSSARSRLAEGLLDPKKLREQQKEINNFYSTFKMKGIGEKPLVTPPDEIDASTKAWDKQVEAISKNIAVMKADAATVDASVGVHEQFRTELQLLEAASRDNKNITQAQIDKYTEYRASMSMNEALVKSGIKLTDDQIKKMGELGEASSKARMELLRNQTISQANFDIQSAFLTDIDKQIAQVQKQLHGTNWMNFMNDGLAATMRLAAVMRDFGQVVTTNVTTALTDLAMGTKSAGDAFRDLAQTVLKALTEILIKVAIVGPAVQALTASLGGGLFGTGSLLSFTGGFAKGAAFNAGSVVPFARGGVVAAPTLFPMARGMGLMGESGPEGILPLKRDSSGRLGVMSQTGGTGARQINIHSSYNIEGAINQKELAAAIRLSHQQAVRQAVQIANSSVPGRSQTFQQLGT